MTIMKPDQQNDDAMSKHLSGAPWHARIRRGPRNHDDRIELISPTYRYRLRVAEHYLAARADGFKTRDAFDVTALHFHLDPIECWHILNWMGVHPLPKFNGITTNGNLRYQRTYLHEQEREDD